MLNICTCNLLVWKWIDEKFDIKWMHLLCFIFVYTVFLLCAAALEFHNHHKSDTLLDHACKVNETWYYHVINREESSSCHKFFWSGAH